MFHSTGLRNQMLVSAPFIDVLATHVINIYSGTPPASADAALNPDNTLLVTISGEGTGAALQWDTAAADGVVQKAPGQVWKGTVASTGVATFYRMVSLADTGAASTTLARMQGTVAVINADLNMSSVNLVSGAEQKVDNFVASIPSTV